ncbi:hypothetical protein cypCar_00040206 [Cyprinus carpio]|nr:hypothetical protein cypCar_00040206 [Cyprinus carpio]
MGSGRSLRTNTGRLASRAVPIWGAMADQAARGAMTDQAAWGAMAEQTVQEAIALRLLKTERIAETRIPRVLAGVGHISDHYGISSDSAAVMEFPNDSTGFADEFQNNFSAFNETDTIFPRGVKITIAVVYMIVCVVGLVGNCLVMYVIIRLSDDID